MNENAGSGWGGSWVGGTRGISFIIARPFRGRGNEDPVVDVADGDFDTAEFFRSDAET